MTPSGDRLISVNSPKTSDPSHPFHDVFVSSQAMLDDRHSANDKIFGASGV
jgi:hypothetical protein